MRRAEAGDQDAEGQLVGMHRNYLWLLGNLHLDRQLQAKADASDLVQDACLQVHRDFAGFHGNSHGEFLAWLKEIMATRKARLFRRYFGAEQRDVQREQRLEDEFDQSSAAMFHLLEGDGTSPSEHAVRRERAVLLADALANLPADYREIIVLHHFQGLSMPQIAEHVGRSVPSVQKAWSRALVRLRRELKGTL